MQEITPELVEERRKEMNRFSIMAADLKTESEKIREENVRLEKEMDQYNTNYQKLVQSVESLGVREAELQKSIKEKENELVVLGDQVGSARRELNDVTTSRGVIDTEITALRQESESLKADNNVKIQDLSQREIAVNDAYKNIEIIKKELEYKEASLSERERLMALKIKSGV
jgi:chromosome segregation ATPase